MDWPPPASYAGAILRYASAWKFYDADLKKLLASGEGDGNTGAHPKGAYLLLYGTPMTAITLTLMAKAPPGVVTWSLPECLLMPPSTGWCRQVPSRAFS